MPEAAKTESISEVFLSPRVIDRGAFDDYSSRLRALISEATGESRRLGDAAIAASAARDDLRAATGRTADQAQNAVELARALGARIHSLEAALERAAALAERVDSAERRIQAAIGSLATREAAITALTAKIDSVNLPAMLAGAELAATRLAALRQSAESAADRLARSLDGAVEFTDRIIEQHDAMRRDLSAGIDTARDAVKVRDGVVRDLKLVAECMGRVASGARTEASLEPSPHQIGAD